MNRTCTLSAMLLALLCLAMPQGLLAQHGENADEAEFHQNHFSVFLGGTTESEEDETTTSFSIGVDYERRLSRLMGIGFGAEYVFVDVGREALAGLLGFFHVTEGFVLLGGPGLEFAQEPLHEVEAGGEVGKISETSEDVETERETNLVFRLGTLYEFEVGHQYTIAPSLFVDFIENKDPAFVWGLSFGIGF